MKICPECNCDKLSENTKFCPECGFKFNDQIDSNQSDENLEFKITEKETDNYEFISDTDKLEVEGPNGSYDNENAVDSQLEKELEPDEEELELLSGIGSGFKEEKNSQEIVSENPDNEKTKGFKKLTSDEIKEIEEKLYKNETQLDDKQQSKNRLFGNDPITPNKKDEQTNKKLIDDSEPSLDIPSPTMAEHGRGVAFFYKRYIELVGSHELRPSEDIVVGKKTYELKPKQIDPKILIGGAASIFVVLLIFIGSMIIGDSSQGHGNVWGIALDEYSQPLISKAKVKFPELGKTIDCNSEGFFVFKDIPSGTHKVQLLWGEEIIGENYTTVTGNKLTTLTLRPSEKYLAKFDKQSNTDSNTSASTTKNTENNSNVTKVSTQKKTQKSKKSSTSKWAKLSLEANIDNAVISLDGSTIGAGNLIYSKLKPGDYQYLVKKKGYYSKSGSVTLKAGKTKKLEVILNPLSEEDLRKTFSSKDFYNSGLKANSEENYLFAIDEFTLALDKDPSFIDAYKTRAETYNRLKDWDKAHDDYLRIAEISQFNSDYNQSISAYNKAVELNDKSIPAYLGRAKLYMVKDQEIAALPDFETVLKLDKKNSEANYGLGIIRYNQKSYKKAIKLFKEALSLDEKNPMIHQYLMLSYYARNDKKNLKKAYSKFEKKVSTEQIDEFRSNAENYAVIQIIDKSK